MRAHLPEATARFPRLHAIVKLPSCVYPEKHVGVHVDPDAVGDGQPATEKVVEVVSAGRGQGFGLHAPAGEEKAPREHVIARDPFEE